MKNQEATGTSAFEYLKAPVVVTFTDVQEQVR